MQKEIHSVTEYDRLRRYLEPIYLYGFLSRDDLQRLYPGEIKNYDFCLQLVKDIYPELSDGRWRNRKKYFSVPRDPMKCERSRISSTYFLKSLKDQELLDTLEYFRRLHNSSENISVLVQELANENAAPSTVRRRLSELLEFGYLEQNGHTYRMHRSPLSCLSDSELIHVYRYICFSDGTTYPRVAGRFLLRSAEREMLYRGISISKRPLFSFFGSPNHNAFDEDIVYTLASLIQNGQGVTIETSHQGKKSTHHIIPIQLRLDRRLGRWYLLSLEDVPTMRRISRIRRVLPGKKLPPQVFQQARDQVLSCFSFSCFSAACPERGPSRINVVLHFEDAPYLLHQFLRELRCGSIRAEDGELHYHLEINDFLEAVPLLRSYAPWLSFDSDNSGLGMYIRSDLLQIQQDLEETI